MNAYTEWFRRELGEREHGPDVWGRWQTWVNEVPRDAYSEHRINKVTRQGFQLLAAAAAAAGEDPDR